MRNECSVPRSIFEVGCGSGALLREFSTLWPEALCFGIDPALPGPVRSDSKLQLERGFLEDVPNDIRTFDLIVAVNVIEHVSSPAEFLSCLQARLSPIGRMLIVCPSAEPPNAELLFLRSCLWSDHKLAPLCGGRNAIGGTKAVTGTFGDRGLSDGDVRCDGSRLGAALSS